MMNAFRRPVTTWCLLCAFLVVACVPPNVFRLNVCDEGCVVLESVQATDACPCEPLHGPDRGDVGTEDGAPPSPDPDDEGSCCTDVPLPNLRSEKPTLPDAATDGPRHSHAAPSIPPADPGRAGSGCALAPSCRGSPAPRRLRELRSVVLLV